MVLMDGSGSVGASGFDDLKDFVSDIASNVLPDPPDGRTRMGIIRFATNANLLYQFIEDQTSSVVQAFTQAITYPGGWTNTLAAIQQSITEFDTYSTGDRGKAIILITDGVPANPGGGSQNVCALASSVMSRGIRVLLVGFGNFNPSILACLVNDQNDIVQAGDFDDAVLDATTTFVNPQVSGVTLTATVSPSFEVVAGPTKFETYLIDGTDPSKPSYNAGTRTLTWSLDPVDRQIRNITLDLDPASGNVPVCGVKPALTGLTVNYDDPATGTPLSASLPPVDIEVTGCPPPVVTPTVTGTLGLADWYTSDVTVSWTVESVEAVDQLIGCDEVTFTEDADGTELTCTATSVAGEGSATVNFKRDATAPVITFGNNLGTYPLEDAIGITCSVEDPTSGVAMQVCPTATEFGLGTHTLNASATDNAGNTSEASTTYEVTNVAILLLLDADAVDKDKEPNYFTEDEVNEGIAGLGQRTPLPVIDATTILFSGEVGDEGWFAPKTIPASWRDAGPTNDGLRNYVGNPVGSGLGVGGDPEALLDNIPDVTPLRASGLKALEGTRVCAVVYKSDISINYDPLEGSLKGDTRGIMAFEVKTVTELTGHSSSSLPEVDVEILDANQICEGALELFADAPEPTSSSEPFDVVP